MPCFPRLPGGASTLSAALLGLALCAPARRAAAADDDPNHLVRGSAVVDFSVERLGAAAARPGPIREGDYVEVRFRMRDAATGAPLAGVKPAAWLDIGTAAPDAQGGQRDCKDKVGLYLKGIVGIRPMIDLNSSYLLVLNQDPSISVIDPIVSMTGRTSLFATVILKRPPADWARSADSRRIYVTVPLAGEVAVVDTETFKVVAAVEAGRHPVRIALQGDGRRLWVGDDAAQAGGSGVTVIDTRRLERLARIPTGRGHHELAFSPDGRHAFVSNREQGTVSVIDAERLVKVRDLPTGPMPISLGVSSLSQALYVADGRTGTVTVVDTARLEVLARVATRPGLGPLRVTLDGRFAVAVNPAEHAVHVLDTTSNTLVHTIPVGGTPYQVAFTRAFAYVRLLDSERVVMINLGTLGPGQTPIVQGFEAGTGAPRQAGELSIADSIVPATFDASVYLVNPADNFVYFYMEGMNAPMGSYGAYGHAARAVTVVDRSLQELGPGLYGGTLRIPAAGRYDVAFLLDNPRVLHCFSLEALPNPALRHELGTLAVQYLDTPPRAAAGAPLPVRFRLADPATGAPRAGLADVRVVSYLAPGQLRGEAAALEIAPGTYQVTLRPSRPGAWYLHVLVPSLGVKASDLPFHSVIVEAAPAAGRPPDGAAIPARAEPTP